MTQIRLTVLGEPSAQPRHRYFQRGTFVQSYDPASAKKKTFASILEETAPETPINVPIAVELTFFMSRPRTHYGTGRKAGFLKDSAPEWHTGRPDLDNLCKFTTDALNRIYWHDDSLICQMTAKKLYSERPRTEIIIKTL